MQETETNDTTITTTQASRCWVHNGRPGQSSPDAGWDGILGGMMMTLCLTDADPYPGPLLALRLTGSHDSAASCWEAVHQGTQRSEIVRRKEK